MRNSFYLSSFHRSYSSRGSQKLRISTSSHHEQLIEAIVIHRVGSMECFRQNSTDLEKIFSIPINFEPCYFGKIENTEGVEDLGVILTNDCELLFFYIISNRIEVNYRCKLEYKTIDDLQFFSTQTCTNGSRCFGIFDRNSEIIIFNITQENRRPSIQNKFNIFSMVGGVLIFPTTNPTNNHIGDSLDGLSLGLISGSPIFHYYITFLDINPRSGQIEEIIERKDIDLASKDGSDIIQEKIFNVFELSQTLFLIFCSFSLKLVSVKLNGIVEKESVKMHYANQIRVVLLAKEKDRATFLYSIQSCDDMKSLLYLIEVPCYFSKKDIRITYLGESVLLSSDPIALSKDRFLVTSSVEDCYIFDITPIAKKDPKQPHLNEIKRFSNLGIITNIIPNGQQKRLIIQSFKGAENITSFQKGIALNQISESPFLKTKIKRLFSASTSSHFFLFVVTKCRTRGFYLGGSFNFCFDKSLKFDEEITFLNCIHQTKYFMASQRKIFVIDLHTRSNVEINSYQVEPAYYSNFSSFENSLAFTKNSNRIYIISYDIDKKEFKENSVSHVYSHNEIIALSWSGYILGIHFRFSEEILILDNNFKLELSIKLDCNESISSLFATIILEDTYQIIAGTSHGNVRYYLRRKESIVLSNEIFSIGNTPILLSRIDFSNQFFVSCDEPSIFSVNEDCRYVDFSPFCNTKISSLNYFKFRDNPFSIYLEDNIVKIGSGHSSILEEVKTDVVSLTPDGIVDSILMINKYYLATFDKQLHLFSQVNLKKMDSLSLGTGQIEEIVFFEDIHACSFIIASINLPREGSEEEYTGNLVIVQIFNDKMSIVKSFGTSVGINSIAKLNGGKVLILLGDSTLKVYQINIKKSESNDNLDEKPKVSLKEIYLQNMRYLIDSIQTKGNHILISDFYWSVHLYEFEELPFPRLKLLSKITHMFNQVTSINLLNNLTYSIGDNSNNLFIYKFDETDNKEEQSLFNAEEIAKMGVSESIIFQRQGVTRYPLTHTHKELAQLHENKAIQYLILGGSAGSIKILYEIPTGAYNILLDLSRVLLNSYSNSNAPIRKEDSQMIRTQRIAKCKSRGIIDGDVVKEFLQLSDEQAHIILSKMRHSDVPTVSEMRNLIRLLEKGQLILN